MLISSIYEPVQQGMAEMEERLKAAGKVDLPWMAEPLRYVLEGGGKRLRPALTLLAGRFYHYNPEQLIPMATAIELFHTATLVHDDAVDKSLVRRGRPTVNSLWGEGIAVLLGDYLFANSSELICSTGNLRVVRLFAQMLMNISSGQLRQFMSAYDWRQDREDYYQQISSKTASLFSTATEAGAILSEAPEEGVEALGTYGHGLGMAFQIVDDILDFIGEEEEMGKPVGSDLLQGTLTLPAILLMEQYPDDALLREIFEKRGDRAGMQRVIEMIRNSSIVQECYKIAADFCSRACHALEVLPEKDCRSSLLDLADYVIERRR
ncbi:MAG: polyprenyl synthetase family protein [Dehalococcoidia bacterium]|nr:MAG: polyprenyl synthetase family protein [Dehalococcoidia bacterium]